MLAQLFHTKISTLILEQNLVPGNNTVRKIEHVSKRSLWGYKGDDWIAFMKLTISDPRSLPKVRDKYLGLIMLFSRI